MLIENVFFARNPVFRKRLKLYLLGKKINNELNINFPQNSPLDIQNTNSSKFCID